MCYLSGDGKSEKLCDDCFWMDYSGIDVTDPELEGLCRMCRRTKLTGGENFAGFPKVVRDGKVAVLISANYGAGISDDCPLGGCKFNPALVAEIERRPATASVKIEWIPVGARFFVSGYDGFEQIELKSSIKWDRA